MARNQLNKILSDPDKGMDKTFGINGVLARLFRKMLRDNNMNWPRWGQYMSDFLTDPRNDIPDNRKDQTSMRGNITKELVKPQMTWKVFCKGLRFLKVWRVEIAIKAFYENGKTSIHSTSLNFGEASPDPQDLNATDKPPPEDHDLDGDETDY